MTDVNGQIPFEGDTFIPLEILSLKSKFKLKHFIETGTQYGATTEFLSDYFKGGINFTIEADEDYFVKAAERLEHSEVALILDRSEVALGHLKPIENTLFFLDAHGCATGGCPLKEELSIIADYKLKNKVIVIHDFKVPNYPDFGFDTYDFELNFEEIEKQLKQVYPEGFNYHYNSQANGAKRGIIYIYPKL